jgi:hypothetical protein
MQKSSTIQASGAAFSEGTASQFAEKLRTFLARGVSRDISAEPSPNSVA